jgi:hypothetical protein
MLPFAYGGGAPMSESNPKKKQYSSSLLHKIVESGKPSLCNNDTFRALVEYKWQTYGRRLFQRQLYSYCFGLSLLMALLFVRRDSSRDGSEKDHLFSDRVTVAVVAVLVLESLWCLSRECYELSVLKWRSYFGDDWKNSVDLAVMALS